jgi:alginate O-acetyltransferase complex protein AlgJ
VLALVALALLGLGVWQAAGTFANPDARQRLADNLSTEAFIAGRTTLTLNDIMAHSLPADAWLRAAGGVLRWQAFGSGGPQVRPGCDGWLFLTEELRPWPGAEASLEARAAGLLRIAAELRERGIALLVAISPDKAAIQAEQLCGAPYATESRQRTAAFTARLIAGGITPVDLPGLLRAVAPAEPLYFRTDTHWNARGAGLAAQAIAAAARPLPLRRSSGFAARPAASEAEGPGDLLRLMGLDSVPDRLRPRADLWRPPQSLTPEPATDPGLLDDDAAATPEVVLIGSSFAMNGGFLPQLQAALGAPVASFAQAGGGFAGSAMRYFASPAWRETPPKLIIWEVLGRSLTVPASPAERAFLADGLR